MNRPGPGHPPQLGSPGLGDERMRPRLPNTRRRKQQGMGPMSWIVLGVLSAFGLIGGAAAVFILTMPKDFVRDRVTAEVKRQTGRDLIIAGPAGFKLFPSIGISLADVSLSAPEGTTDKPLVAMSSLDVSVRLLPLLHRQVTIERLVLQKPVFELHVDAQGRKSWDMAAADGTRSRKIRLAQVQAPGTASDAPADLPQEAKDFLKNSGAPEPQQSEPSEGEASAGLDHLELGDVRIEDGTVNYSDARTGARQSVTAINMRLGLKSISQPLEAKGDLVWNAEKVVLDGSLTSVQSILEQRPAKIAMKIDSARVAGAFDGSVSIKDAVDSQGKLTAKATSAKALAKWLGTELPPVPGFGPLDFSSDVRAAGKTISLTNTNVMLDGANLTGQVSVDTSGAKPYVKGALAMSELDLNKYIGSDGSAGASTPASRSGVTDDGATSEAAPSAPGPKVKGFTQRAASPSGWSEGQIDASALGLADADLKLTLGKLLVNKIKVGKSQLTVALKSAVMKTTFDDVQLYGGRGTGLLTVDATQPLVVAVSSNLNLDAIQAQPLLKDAADMDMLAGTGKVTVAVSGQGKSQRQIIETLNGKTDFAIANGAIVGWNIPAIVRGVSQGRLSGLDRTPSEKTDFSELVSTWTITNGLAQNQDLRLISPLLRVTGAGNVMLPAREIDYMLKPSLVASLEGQGATAQSQGLEIPIHITGSWEKPKLKPDASGILKDPNQAIQAVKDLGKQFKGKSAQEIVDGLLGSKANDGDAAAPADGTKPSDKEKAKKLLEGLFKR